MQCKKMPKGSGIENYTGNMTSLDRLSDYRRGNVRMEGEQKQRRAEGRLRRGAPNPIILRYHCVDVLNLCLIGPSFHQQANRIDLNHELDQYVLKL